MHVTPRTTKHRIVLRVRTNTMTLKIGLTFTFVLFHRRNHDTLSRNTMSACVLHALHSTHRVSNWDSLVFYTPNRAACLYEARGQRYVKVQHAGAPVSCGCMKNNRRTTNGEPAEFKTGLWCFSGISLLLQQRAVEISRWGAQPRQLRCLSTTACWKEGMGREDGGEARSHNFHHRM